MSQLGSSRAVGLKTIREQIVDHLRTDILSGALGEDEPVREAQLAERFGVSRGPIRDALLQLSQEGGLIYQPNCGMRVSPVRDELDRSLFARMRADVECHALRIAWDRIKPEVIATWQEMADQITAACEAKSVTKIVASDMAFHRDLMKRSESADLESVWLSVAVRMRLQYSQHPDWLVVAREHREILRAIAERQLDRATTLLRKHIV